MPLGQRIALLAVGAALLGVAAYWYRSGRLRRECAAVWGGAGLLLLLFAAIPALFVALAGWFALDADLLMTVLWTLVLAALLLHGSLVLSRLARADEQRVQEVAGLKEELERLREELRQAQRPPLEAKPRPPSLRT